MATLITRADLLRKIARKDELIRKWTVEAAQHPGMDFTSRTIRSHALGMARRGREEKE